MIEKDTRKLKVSDTQIGRLNNVKMIILHITIPAKILISFFMEIKMCPRIHRDPQKTTSRPNNPEQKK